MCDQWSEPYSPCYRYWMPRAQTLSPTQRKSVLLAAARGVFSAHGYHRASISQIVAAAGVARGTFYNYFDSKRAIFQAILDELMDAINAAVVPIDITRPIPPQVLINLENIIHICTQPEVARILFAEAAGIDSEGDEALRVFYRQCTERIVRALNTGQDMGIVRAGNMTLTAQMLLGIVTQPVLASASLSRRISSVLARPSA